ncbi:DNA topoisomerase VI subunit B [Methanospirillum lacunae]|uniref:Type 2 DNA topoisomerase 6 subunit B n=1 Tax=Methanospirillum lacunae TaxID=668570 RepID=A0A2V2MXQ7_9EURY|nr:DNA topoisomerase VI subunit B [Methanospirillum lacunae]PWR72702.1 DNA topoisomerase VI subunit B [Methanospirillum lacunae]
MARKKEPVPVQAELPAETLADELARQQRSISVAEFFEKNKHLLGFDSPVRGIITTVKEAIDNALDACEEAGVLPDIYLGIFRMQEDVFKVVVEDNGPGIVPENIPFVFGKLLYGSRFHQIRQSRGQQGIGISAAVLYAQLTTGTPTLVISRCGADRGAFRMLIQIKTETNEPEILSREEITWDRTHGTRIEIEFRSSLTARKRLIEYLRYTSVVNPHCRIRVDLDGETMTFDRASEEPIVPPKAIKPHPHGVELGELKRMAAATNETLRTFLIEGFTRVGEKTATEILNTAGMPDDRKASSLKIKELGTLLAAMQSANVPPPPAQQCLSPIGEDLIRQGLEKEFQLDYISARTRPAAVYHGHPFIVEAALGWGGKLEAEGTARIMRFANRVPLMYQQGACAVTGCISGVNWKTYGIGQQGLPTGPLIILVHVASTNVPFTSESKDAVASIPEIEREITLALQDLGRDLKTFIQRRDRSRQSEERARAICSIIPDIAAKVAETLDLPVPDTSPIEGQIMRRLVAKKRTTDGIVSILVSNYTSHAVDISLYAITQDDPQKADKPPVFVEKMGDDYSAVWQLRLAASETWITEFPGTGRGSIDIRGIDEKKKVVVDLDR